METNKNNDIDVRKIVRTVWKHWWWFAIGVVFFLLMGILYYLRKNPTWNTEASIVLRQGGEFGGLSDQIGSGLAMLGLGGNAAGEDEVVVLSSRDLMAQAIDALNLWEYSYVKDKMRWKGEFRNPAMTIDYIQLTEDAEIYPFSVKVYPSKRGYKVKTRLGYFISSSKRVKDLNEPIETAIGTIRIHANRPLSTDTAYKVVHKRHELVVADFRELVNVALHKKESNIIKLSMRSAMPERDRVLLHQLIEQYNLNSVIDKNMLTQNTAGFIEERLNIITAELSEAEKTVSSYKERNNIANIEAQAKLFLEASSEEQRAMAEVETQLRLVDYGDEFLRVIKEYVEENEIIRPEDLRIRTVAKKSTRKKQIIQAIDRRVDLDDLAESCGMSMEEMMDELESIVFSGTKINIDYFIQEVVDPDEEEEIYDYFKEADDDGIKKAMEELGEDYYDEMHVRLVRLKFHCDLGN